MPGRSEGRDQNWLYTWKYFPLLLYLPDVWASSAYPDWPMLLVWPNQGSCSSCSYVWPLTSKCSDNFLVKSICYLSSCIPVSSRAFPDLPSQSINCPFPLVEHTYRKCESLWEGFKTIDVPPELTIICSAELWDLSFCLLQITGLLREGPTFITLNLKKNKARIVVKSRPTEPYEKNMKLQKSLLCCQGKDIIQNLNFKRSTILPLKYFNL